jgi:hypothetical protein
MTSQLNNEPQPQVAAVMDSDGQVGPTPPTPIPDIIEALRGVELLNGLTEEEYRWLAVNGTERRASHRAVVVRENEPAHHMNIILEGEVNVSRANSGSVSFMGRTARVTGKLPFSRMKFWGATGYSAGHLWVLDIHEDLFRRSTKTLNCVDWAACSAPMKNWQVTPVGPSDRLSRSRTSLPTKPVLPMPCL